MDNNKVLFGLSNVHIATYNEVNGVAAIGKPKKMPGAVNLSVESSSSDNPFYADNIVYFNEFVLGSKTGELQMAKFPDWFKVEYLNYEYTSDGGIGENVNKRGASFVLIFDGEGDKHKRRHLLYNVSAGAIRKTHATITDSKEPEVESVPITVVGNGLTGFRDVHYYPGDAGFDKALTAPVVPSVISVTNTSDDTTLSHSKASGSDATITVASTLENNKITTVVVDGKVLAANQATVEGLTATLQKGFLDSLVAGDHEFVVGLEYGADISGVITVGE